MRIFSQTIFNKKWTLHPIIAVLWLAFLMGNVARHVSHDAQFCSHVLDLESYQSIDYSEDDPDLPYEHHLSTKFLSDKYAAASIQIPFTSIPRYDNHGRSPPLLS